MNRFKSDEGRVVKMRTCYLILGMIRLFFQVTNPIRNAFLVKKGEPVTRERVPFFDKSSISLNNSSKGIFMNVKKKDRETVFPKLIENVKQEENPLLTWNRIAISRYQLPNTFHFLLMRNKKPRKVRFLQPEKKGIANLKKSGHLYTDTPFNPHLHIYFVTLLCLLVGFAVSWAYFPKEILNIPINAIEPTGEEITRAVCINSRELFLDAKEEGLIEQIGKKEAGRFDPLNLKTKGTLVMAVMIATILLGMEFSEYVEISVALAERSNR